MYSSWHSERRGGERGTQALLQSEMFDGRVRIERRDKRSAIMERWYDRKNWMRESKEKGLDISILCENGEHYVILTLKLEAADHWFLVVGCW